jgi:hypothetical protein
LAGQALRKLPRSASQFPCQHCAVDCIRSRVNWAKISTNSISWMDNQMLNDSLAPSSGFAPKSVSSLKPTQICSDESNPADCEPLRMQRQNRGPTIALPAPFCQKGSFLADSPEQYMRGTVHAWNSACVERGEMIRYG